MSLSDRRIFLTSLAALAGCGFTPVYGPGGGGLAFYGQVAITTPNDRNEFNLVRQLEQRLGRNTGGAYALSYELNLVEDELGILPDQTITRYNVSGQANFTVIRVATDEVVTSGKVQSFTSYAATGTTVSTLTAEGDAYARLMVILADQIVTRLMATADAFQA